MKRSNHTVFHAAHDSKESLLNEIQELEVAVVRNLPEDADDVLQAYFDGELPTDQFSPESTLPDYEPLLTGMSEEEYKYHADNFKTLDASIQKVRELLALVRSCKVDSFAG